MVSRDRRLRLRQDFESVRAHGRRAGDSILLLTAAPNGLEFPRFGLAVGKRVGNAVVRNAVKRRIRESIRPLDATGCMDVIVSARPSAAKAESSAFRASLGTLLTRLGMAPGSDQR